MGASNLVALAVGLPILAFWLAFNVSQLALAWIAFGWDHESRRPLWSLPLQQIAYRQLMYLVVIDSVMVALTVAPPASRCPTVRA